MSCYNTSWCRMPASAQVMMQALGLGCAVWVRKLYLQQDMNIWLEILAHSSQDTALIRFSASLYQHLQYLHTYIDLKALILFRRVNWAYWYWLSRAGLLVTVRTCAGQRETCFMLCNVLGMNLPALIYPQDCQILNAKLPYKRCNDFNKLEIYALRCGPLCLLCCRLVTLRWDLMFYWTREQFSNIPAHAIIIHHALVQQQSLLVSGMEIP